MIFPLAFRLLYPTNLRRVGEILVKLAIFEILPAEAINKALFSFTESNEAENVRLESIGYEG